MSPDDGLNERRRDAERKRKARAEARVVEIPECANRRRRTRLEKNDEKWLRHYFGPDSGCEQPFTYVFTEQQREIIAAIGRAFRVGGDQALAASRGEGKTTIAERLMVKYVASGEVPFAVLFGANGESAGDSLNEIKIAFESNEALWLDYPEICEPIRALEGTPNRAHYQLCSGVGHVDKKPYTAVPSKFTWSGKGITLPAIPGAPGAGGIIATRGLDGAVRGLKKKGRRPWVAVIDDPDTEDTARSEDQAQKLETRIDRAIAGLGSQTRAIARVMLCTIQTLRSIAAKYTDPQQKPSWNGKRFRFLVQPPNRLDLWDEYVQRRIAEQQAGDPEARGTHRWYLANRRAMDAGHKIANPNRFDAEKLADGSQREVSALQRYFNEVARIGQEAVSTEYDNDPREESGPMVSNLSARRIQKQCSGYGRHVIPPGCTLMTQGIDVRKTALHWVVRAWRTEPWAGYTVAYGVQDVLGTVAGSDEGVDQALRRAIHARWTEFREQEWIDQEDNVVETPDSLTLIDAGWKTDVIYQVCQELGAGVMPSMGFGKSNGCVGAVFRSAQKNTRDKKLGDGWFLSRRGKLWLVCFDADRWKSYEHDRWLCAPAHPGALLNFGERSTSERFSFDEKAHFAYARHIVAEMEEEDVVKGVLKRAWKVKSANNHWLDASVLSDVAAAMRDVVWRVATPKKKASKAKESTKDTPAEPMRRARRVPRRRVAYM